LLFIDELLIFVKTIKKHNIMNKEELFDEMKAYWETFEAEHNETTKAAAGRARKAIGELKKLVTDYRKASVDEGK
jgi:hypothetical protein